MSPNVSVICINWLLICTLIICSSIDVDMPNDDNSSDDDDENRYVCKVHACV